MRKTESSAQLRRVELPYPPEVLEKEKARREKRQSLRVIEGGKKESAKTIRRTAEQEQEAHLEALRAAGTFEHKTQTIRALHGQYQSEQEDLLQKEGELRSELEDVLGPLEGNTADEIREHHMNGWHKFKDFIRGISGEKTAQQRATPLLKKLAELQAKRKNLHEQQINVSIASLRSPAAEPTKSLEQQSAEAWTPPARIEQALEPEPEIELTEKDFMTEKEASLDESLSLANKIFPPTKESLEFKKEEELKQTTEKIIDLLGNVKEGLSDKENEERRARGRAEGARLWDEINRTIELMKVPESEFTALDYVELAARAQKIEADHRPNQAASVRGILKKMNNRLGYAPGQDPLTGIGMGSSRLLETKALGGRLTHSDQSNKVEKITGVNSDNSNPETRKFGTEKSFDQPLSLDWASAMLTPDVAKKSWEDVKNRMLPNMEISKAVIRDHIDILTQEIASLEDLATDVYKNFNNIKSIKQGEPAEATMYVMLKAISEGTISLSEGDKKALTAVRRALKDIDRSIAAVTAPVENTPKRKNEVAPAKRSTDDLDVLNQTDDVLKRAVGSDMFRSATLPDETPSQRALKKLAISTAEINELEPQAEIRDQQHVPENVIDALVHNLPEKAVASYREAMTKFYATDNLQKRRDILIVLRGLDAKYHLKNSKTAQNIAKTLNDALEQSRPKATKKPVSIRRTGTQG